MEVATLKSRMLRMLGKEHHIMKDFERSIDALSQLTAELCEKQSNAESDLSRSAAMLHKRATQIEEDMKYQVVVISKCRQLHLNKHKTKLLNLKSDIRASFLHGRALIESQPDELMIRGPKILKQLEDHIALKADYSNMLQSFGTLEYIHNCDPEKLLCIATVGYIKNGDVNISDFSIRVGPLVAGIRRTMINTDDEIQVTWPAHFRFVDFREHLVVSLTDPRENDVKFTHEDDGIYKFRMKLPGLHKFSVKVYSSHIQASPLTILCEDIEDLRTFINQQKPTAEHATIAIESLDPPKSEPRTSPSDAMSCNIMDEAYYRSTGPEPMQRSVSRESVTSTGSCGGSQRSGLPVINLSALRKTLASHEKFNNKLMTSPAVKKETLSKQIAPERRGSVGSETPWKDEHKHDDQIAVRVEQSIGVSTNECTDNTLATSTLSDFPAQCKVSSNMPTVSAISSEKAMHHSKIGPLSTDITAVSLHTVDVKPAIVNLEMTFSKMNVATKATDVKLKSVNKALQPDTNHGDATYVVPSSDVQCGDIRTVKFKDSEPTKSSIKFTELDEPIWDFTSLETNDGKSKTVSFKDEPEFPSSELTNHKRLSTSPAPLPQKAGGSPFPKLTSLPLVGTNTDSGTVKGAIKPTRTSIPNAKISFKLETRKSLVKPNSLWAFDTASTSDQNNNTKTPAAKQSADHKEVVNKEAGNKEVVNREAGNKEAGSNKAGGFSYTDLMSRDNKLYATFSHSISGQFRSPTGVGVYNRNVVICDRGHHCVLVFDWAGKLLRTLKGNPQFRNPSAVLINTAGEMFIKDNIQIQVCTLTGTTIRTIGQGILKEPYGLAWVPNGELLTLDHTMGNLVVFSQSGKKTHQARFQPIYQPGIREPRCRFIDVNMAKAYPIVVVSDLGRDMVYMTDIDGQILRQIRTPSPFRFVAGISCDTKGNFLVANCKANHIQAFREDGEFLSVVELSRSIQMPSDILITDSGYLLIVNYIHGSVSVFFLEDNGRKRVSKW